MSDSSASPSEHPLDDHPPKRKAAHAGLDGHGIGRSVKRRASKACQCCRSRKVRCNVTEHGAPCTNCRLDEVECIVSESRRKKKWGKEDGHAQRAASKNSFSLDGKNGRKLNLKPARNSVAITDSTPSPPKSREHQRSLDEHVPHSIYQSHGSRLPSMGNYADLHRMSSSQTHDTNGLASLVYADRRFGSISSRGPVLLLPFVKPLPSRIGSDEVNYLAKKGALNLPSGVLRKELLRAFIEFVHPYMPLLNLHDFLSTIDRPDGSRGKVSLILFQAVMFAGSAFVDMSHLRTAGYHTRKEARKDFFQKTRILYDFDYESDRVSLVQALLLLTYYYETPDDQKDTWHWMGVATSLAHTIGLHRNPDRSNMDSKRTKLWKRIWWSTYMRDRLIALGMRRPTRIKTEDFDVPMLTLDDFELSSLPESVSCVPADCRVARDVGMQRQMAIMCIEKAKLCLCISNVLSKQYCVLNNNQGMETDRTTMMLLPKKLDPETSEVQACDEMLQTWVRDLPDEAKYSETYSGVSSLDVNRALLHMVFFTTLSALHRPQVLPSASGLSEISPVKHGLAPDILEISRRTVRRAASAITAIAEKLDSMDLVRYLPTTGVTVLLPAIIIHLLDIKAPDEETQRASLRSFRQCMIVMSKMRDLYAAADYSTAFLEAAIRKAGIQITPMLSMSAGLPGYSSLIQPTADIRPAEEFRRADQQTNSSMDPRRYMRTTLTPPPDAGTTSMHLLEKTPLTPNVTEEEVARRLETFLASTPPESDHDQENAQIPGFAIPLDDSSTEAAPLPFNKYGAIMNQPLPPANNQTSSSINHHQDDEELFSSLPMSYNFDDGDFDSLLNLDAVGEAFSFDDPTLEAGLGDVDWLGNGTTLAAE